MTPPHAAPQGRTGWPQALAYALVEWVPDELGTVGRTDLDSVLAAVGGLAAVNRHRRSQRAARRPWPHRVPEELRADISPAQFQALLNHAVTKVRAAATSTVSSAGSSEQLSAEEVRLLQEVPPHHGS